MKLHAKEGRTGRPPMRETAASLMSLTSSIVPSGTPRSTLVSTPVRSSSSESDQLLIWEGMGSGMNLMEKDIISKYMRRGKKIFEEGGIRKA